LCAMRSSFIRYFKSLQKIKLFCRVTRLSRRVTRQMQQIYIQRYRPPRVLQESKRFSHSSSLISMLINQAVLFWPFPVWFEAETGFVLSHVFRIALLALQRRESNRF
jgi:hypothetical protein